MLGVKANDLLFAFFFGFIDLDPFVVALGPFVVATLTPFVEDLDRFVAANLGPFVAANLNPFGTGALDLFVVDLDQFVVANLDRFVAANLGLFVVALDPFLAPFGAALGPFVATKVDLAPFAAWLA